MKSSRLAEIKARCEADNILKKDMLELIGEVERLKELVSDIALDFRDIRDSEEIRKMLHTLADYELTGLEPTEIDHLVSIGIGEVAAQLKKAEAERDALLSDYAEVTSRVTKCPICKNYTGVPLNCGNVGLGHCKGYRWRGLRENST